MMKILEADRVREAETEFAGLVDAYETALAAPSSPVFAKLAVRAWVVKVKCWGAGLNGLGVRCDEIRADCLVRGGG